MTLADRTCLHLAPAPTCPKCGWDTETNRKATALMSATDIPTPTPADVEFAERYRLMGYWYAVGRADGSETADLAAAFAPYVEARAAAYRAEKVTFLPSIPDMWKEFVGS